jgi:hypothetical protein
MCVDQNVLIEKIEIFIRKHALRPIQYFNIYSFKNKKLLTIYILYGQDHVIREKVTCNFLVTILMWNQHNVHVQLFNESQHGSIVTTGNVSREIGFNEWTDLKILGAKPDESVLLKCKRRKPLLILCRQK